MLRKALRLFPAQCEITLVLINAVWHETVGEVKHVPQIFVIYHLVLALYQIRGPRGQGLSVSFMSQHSIWCVLEDSKCLLNE